MNIKTSANGESISQHDPTSLLKSENSNMENFTTMSFGVSTAITPSTAPNSSEKIDSLEKEIAENSVFYDSHQRYHTPHSFYLDTPIDSPI